MNEKELKELLDKIPKEAKPLIISTPLPWVVAMTLGGKQ